MPNHILFATATNNGSIDKEIRELEEHELCNYKKIGEKAIGNNIYHCIHLANKYVQNFWARVLGYRILKDDHEALMFAEETKKENLPNNEYIAVEFFEYKHDSDNCNDNSEYSEYREIGDVSLTRSLSIK